MKKQIIKILETNKYNILQKNYLMSSSYYLMYSKLRLNNGKKMYESYDGYLQCGCLSLITLDLLRKNNIKDIKVYTSKIGYGKYIEDHAYLKIGNLLIDPTYKQFMRDDRIIDTSILNTINNNYQKFVYETLPYFFVGTLDDLSNIYKKSIEINKTLYPMSLNDIDDDILCFFQNPKDVTDYFIKNIYRVNIIRNDFEYDKKI